MLRARLGIGHWALGMGHGAWGIGNLFFLPLLPLSLCPLISLMGELVIG
ncbi:hypothetical protein [Nostoc sp.]